MDLVRAVRDAERPLAGVHVGERRPLGDAGGAVHLDRLVDDLAGALRDHRLDGMDPDSRLAVAEHVHRLGGAQDHETHRLDVDAGA